MPDALQVPGALKPKTPAPIAPGAKKSSPLRISDAGEGATKTTDPISMTFARNMTEEDYNAVGPKKNTAKPAASAGGGGGGGGGKGGGIVAEAKKWVGTPYVWGGTKPGGFDCSGFTQYVFKQFGINLPRVSYQQMAAGRQVNRNDLQVGDLVGWDNSKRNPGADHIGIYIGDGQYIAAPKPGDRVKISKLYGNYFATRVL